jgi:hypothetical protein
MNREEDVGQADAPVPIDPTPEVLDRARREFTDDEVAAGLREIEATGGLTFDDVVRGLDAPDANG